MQHQEHGINECTSSFAFLTLILLLLYFAKCRSCSLAIYSNEFILKYSVISQHVADNF